MEKRFINLTNEQRETLEGAFQRGKGARFRQRCHFILLSDQGHEMREIAKIFGTTRQAIRRWFNRYEAEGINGLRTKRKTGRPVLLSVDNEPVVAKIKGWIAEEPRTLNPVLLKIEEELGIKFHKRTLNRFLKNLSSDGNDSEME